MLTRFISLKDPKGIDIIIIIRSFLCVNKNVQGSGESATAVPSEDEEKVHL